MFWLVLGIGVLGLVLWLALSGRSKVSDAEYEEIVKGLDDPMAEGKADSFRGPGGGAAFDLNKDQDFDCRQELGYEEDVRED